MRNQSVYSVDSVSTSRTFFVTRFQFESTKRRCVETDNWDESLHEISNDSMVRVVNFAT
jgi:hypothetical protein